MRGVGEKGLWQRTGARYPHTLGTWLMRYRKASKVSYERPYPMPHHRPAHRPMPLLALHTSDTSETGLTVPGSKP